MRRLFYKLRLLFKKYFARIEYCKDCGRTQELVWHAPNELYAEVTGQKNESDMGGVTCPRCFTKRAELLGKFLRWTPSYE